MKCTSGVDLARLFAVHRGPDPDAYESRDLRWFVNPELV